MDLYVPLVACLWLPGWLRAALPAREACDESCLQLLPGLQPGLRNNLLVYLELRWAGPQASTAAG